MTLAMAAVQLGYFTDREALSDTTMGAACHNTDALTGGTAGMLLLCLQARGMDEQTVGLRERGEENECTHSAQPSYDLI